MSKLDIIVSRLDMIVSKLDTMFLYGCLQIVIPMPESFLPEVGKFS